MLSSSCHDPIALLVRIRSIELGLRGFLKQEGSWKSLLLAEESGNVYHSYVKIYYSVPKQVQLLTGITNRTIETHGVPFRNVMDGQVEFIRCEQT